LCGWSVATILDDQRSLHHPPVQHDDIDYDNGGRSGDPYFDLGEERVAARGWTSTLARARDVRARIDRRSLPGFR
jgi:hypothetical protein